MDFLGKLVLIGAGPGDPELISLKGYKLLQTAKVVLYDSLVNDELLNYINIKAKKIYVGKKPFENKISQDQINNLILENVKEYKEVIRLKGGDPFIFGRGLEEILFSNKNNIQTEYVPGISSFYSVPGMSNIPLTFRKKSESFWVVTGSTQEGKVSSDIELVAKSNATAVILMGITNLEDIISYFLKHRNKSTPVAIIHNGTLKTEKKIFGTISNIVELQKINKLKPPATIIIGEIVNLNKQNGNQ